MISLPNEFELEAEVLSIAMHSKDKLVDIITRVKPIWFVTDSIKRAFSCLIEQFEQGLPTDSKTLANRLLDAGDMEAFNAVVQASGVFLSAERTDFLLDRFYDYHLRRTYYRVGQQLQERAFDMATQASDLSDMVENEILSIVSAEENKEVISAKEAATRALETFYTREAQDYIGMTFSRRREDGSVVGFPGIDVATAGGLQGGDLMIIAAQTGEGKTALALNLATWVSVHGNYRTYYQNTEMKVEEMVFRMISNLSGVPFNEVYMAKLSGTPEEIAKKRADIEWAANAIAKANQKLFLSELPELTPGMSRGLARKFKHKYGKLDLLIIDYVGRMEMDAEMKRAGLQEWQVLSRIAKESKKLAQQLDCAVILLAQLTEEGKLEGARKMLNDTDVALYIERLDDEEKQEYPQATHWLRKRKVRRSGKERDILIRFEKQIQRISEVYYRE